MLSRRKRLLHRTPARANSGSTASAPGRAHFCRALRRNRAGIIALIAVGALVALLTGIGGALQNEWFQREGTPSQPLPSGRFGAANTFDGTRNQPLIFGGFKGSQPNVGVGIINKPVLSPSALGDTWSYNPAGGGWINRNPVHTPSPRGYASMAYDAARKRVVLFGGAPYLSNAASDETWIWDGVDWTQVHTPIRPDARQLASMAYDAHRKLVVLFGGLDVEGEPLNDTWVWNGSNWKILNVPGGPSPRHSAAMAYDLCRAEAVLYGGVPRGLSTPVPPPPGYDPFTSAPAETWTFDGAKWTEKDDLILKPPPKIGASMTYSDWGKRVLMFGGYASTDTGNSLVATDENEWIWDGTSWQRETANPVSVVTSRTAGGWKSGTPPPRAYASFVSNPGGGASLFGGTPADRSTRDSRNPESQLALDDQWDLQEKDSSTCNSPVPIPPDETPIGDQDQDQNKDEGETSRKEIQEFARLPVLLGTDPKTVPQGAPAPPCLIVGGDVGRTHLATDPKRNRVYQFFFCQPDSTSNKKILIQSYDAKSLKPLGSAIAPVTFNQNAIPDFDGNLLMHDARRGRFLLTLGDQAVWIIQQDLIEKGVNPVVEKVTLPTVTPIRSVSFFDHPKTGRAKLLIYYRSSHIPETGTTITPAAVIQFDLESKREDWRRSVEVCTNAGTEGSNSGWSNLRRTMRVENRVYMPCPISGSNQQIRWAVVRIPVVEVPNDPVVTDGEDSPTTLPVEVFPGPYTVGQVWGDPKAERMVLTSDNLFGATLWVFDGKVSRYVGRVGMAALPTVSGDSNQGFGFGFDQETGRLYMLAPDHVNEARGKSTGARNVVYPGGLYVVDTRLTPVPQAESFLQFSYTAQAMMGILPPEEGLPRRVFMRRAMGTTPVHPDDAQQQAVTSDTTSKYPDGEKVQLLDEMSYLVLADSLPVPEQPEIGQLDALTLPVAESAGKTDVSFDAEGSGYGIRLRSVRGISSALRLPPQSGQFKENLEYVEDVLTAARLVPPCFYPDRELVAGWAYQARLSDLEASARSSGLEVDSSSKGDLEGPFSRCNPPISPRSVPSSARLVADVLWPLLPFEQLDNAVGSGILSLEKDPDEDDLQHNTGTGLAWSKRFQEVECVGDFSKTHQATVTVVDVYGSADCKQKEARVEGTARGNFGAAPANSVYSVGEGYSAVTVARDPVKGVVVTSTAEATGIKLPGISIGYVKTEAVVWSNGRPTDEKRATFTRTICRVSPPPNNHPEACLDQAAQQKMAKDFNDRMGINGKMTLPTPDPDFFKGSPGGYAAGVTKEIPQEAEDQYFSRDFQKEVPGLEIVFYKDSLNSGPSRQVLQLAGIRAVTGFGVQCNSDFIYSPSSKSCIALTFEDDPVEFEDEDVSSTDDAAFNSYDDDSGGWVQVEATGAPEGLALGQRLGRFIENLPIIRQLPLRQIGEAFLAGAVWYLLGLPLFFASRRFALNLARRS